MDKKQAYACSIHDGVLAAADSHSGNCGDAAGWSKYVQRLTAEVAQELGVPSHTKVSSELYKLLLYQQGDHFSPHRDTEKSPGMFATLTISLPSKYQVYYVSLSHVVLASMCALNLASSTPCNLQMTCDCQCGIVKGLG